MNTHQGISRCHKKLQLLSRRCSFAWLSPTQCKKERNGSVLGSRAWLCMAVCAHSSGAQGPLCSDCGGYTTIAQAPLKGATLAGCASWGKGWDSSGVPWQSESGRQQLPAGNSLQSLKTSSKSLCSASSGMASEGCGRLAAPVGSCGLCSAPYRGWSEVRDTCEALESSKIIFTNSALWAKWSTAADPAAILQKQIGVSLFWEESSHYLSALAICILTCYSSGELDRNLQLV